MLGIGRVVQHAKQYKALQNARNDAVDGFAKREVDDLGGNEYAHDLRRQR